MKENRPKEMSLIGGLYLFEAVLVFLALIFMGEAGLYTGLRKLISDIPANVLIPAVTMLKLLLVYGYLTMKKWGYWLMLIYSVGIILMNIYLMFHFGINLYIWETIFSLYVLKHTFENKNVFFHV